MTARRVLQHVSGGLIVLETEEERLAREAVRMMTEDAHERAAWELAETTPFGDFTCRRVVNLVGPEAARAVVERAVAEALDPVELARELRLDLLGTAPKYP